MKKSAKALQSNSCVKKRTFTANDANNDKLRELTINLRERIKELNCLYGISRLIEQESASLDDILQGVVELIPASWQYPEDTCARIKLKDREFRTANFMQTAWNQTEIIHVNGEIFGTLDIYYLIKRPDCDEIPFLRRNETLFMLLLRGWDILLNTSLQRANCSRFMNKRSSCGKNYRQKYNPGLTLLGNLFMS